jgi:hypothetical protein
VGFAVTNYKPIMLEIPMNYPAHCVRPLFPLQALFMVVLNTAYTSVVLEIQGFLESLLLRQQGAVI